MTNSPRHIEVGRACHVISKLDNIYGEIVVIKDILNYTNVVVVGSNVTPRKLNVRHIQCLPFKLEGMTTTTTHQEVKDLILKSSSFAGLIQKKK